MKTKRFFLTVMATALMSCPVLFAQNTTSKNPQKENQREQMLELRVQRMQKKLVLDDKKRAEFAPLYKEYLEEIAACYTSTRLSKAGKDITDEERAKRIENSFERRQRVLDTEKEYYAKFKKVLNSRQLEVLFKAQDQTGYNKKANPCCKGKKATCKGNFQGCKDKHKRQHCQRKQHC